MTKTTTHLTEENLSNFKKFAFWSKFLAVIGFIVAGLMILVGLPLLLAFGLGLIYIGIGILYIFIYRNLWKAGQKVSTLADAKSDDEVTNTLLDSFAHLTSYFRITGIIAIIGIVVSLLGVIVFGVLLGSGVSQLNDSGLLELDPSSPTYQEDLERNLQDNFDLDLDIDLDDSL